MKKVISWVLIVFVLLNCSFAIFAADIIKDVVTVKELTKGVVHKRIQRLTTSGMLDIQVIEADLRNEHLSFELLTNAKGTAYLDTVKNLAGENDTVAAINADFFTWVKNAPTKGSAIGPEIIEGGVKSSTGTEAGISAMRMDEDKNFLIDFFKMDITVTAPNGESHKVKGINKFDDLAEIMLYNRYFDTMSLGAGEGVVEVLVVDNVVTEVRVGQPAVEIPENGYILASVIDNCFLIDNLHEGDEVKLNIEANFDLEKTKTMVGGGAILVQNGKVPATFSHNITGTHPRSGIGVDQSGKTVYLVTVDGRLSNSVGLTQREFAYLMAEVGAHNAINFDGGGSTTMVIKEDGAQQVVNTPSDGGQRRVTNAVGIKSSGAPTGEIAAVAIKAEELTVFNGTSFGVELEAFDIYKNKIYAEQADVVWSVEDVDGYIANGFFYPKSAGVAKLTAQYAGEHDVVYVKVLEDPYFLELNLNPISLKTGETKVIWLKGYDYNGESANIYLKDTETKIDSGIASLSGNKITANQKGAGTLSVSFKGVTAYAAVGVDTKEFPKNPQPVTGADPLYGSLQQYDMKFTVFGNTGSYKTLFDLFMINTVSGRLNSEKDNSFAAYVGNNADKNMLGYLKKTSVIADGYSSFKQSGNMFIRLNNKNGTFKDSGQKQWVFIRDTLKAADTQNVFIFMANQKLSDGVENQMFYDMIKEELTGKGKTVYIFTDGEYNSSEKRDGVHFITTAGITGDMVFNNPDSVVGKLKYVVVYVGETVRYEFKDAMPKA